MAATMFLGDSDDHEDDGFVDVTFKRPGDATPSTARLDVLEWHSKITEFYEKNGKKPNGEYNALLADLIEKEAGLPRPSHIVAQQFQHQMFKLATDLFKKKGLLRS